MQTLVLHKLVIGPYEVGELLGQGGMGMVYCAYQPSLKRYVALKVLVRTGNSSSIFDQRFAREVSIAASLEHPHIVPVYDYGSTNETRYVAMRLLTGGSLADHLAERRERQQPYTPDEVNRILTPIASAIDYAHKHGIVHRDIKPSNIMFDEHQSPYLVDFGIARLMDTNSGMTQTGYALGTPAYMPPEQWMGKEATSPSDVYSLGAVTFEMLTLHPPFEASNPFALMQQHVQQTPPLVNDLRPDLPPVVGLAVRQALQKVESDRFPTAGLFAEAFAEATQGRTSTSLTINLASPAAPTSNGQNVSAETVVNAQPRRRRSSLVAALLLFGLLACGGVAFFMRNSMSFVPVAQSPASATPTTTLSATLDMRVTASPGSTIALSVTATTLPATTNTTASQIAPNATIADKYSSRPTRPGPQAPSTTIEVTPTSAGAQPTNVLPTATQQSSMTFTPSPTATLRPTTVPPTPTTLPPTMIPPMPVLPTVVPTAIPPTAAPFNGNSGNGNGNGGGNSSSGNGNGSGSGNSGGNGNGNGKSGGG